MPGGATGGALAGVGGMGRQPTMTDEDGQDALMATLLGESEA